jgi:aconitate hydratase
MFENEYAHAFDGDQNWQTMPVPSGGTFEWDDDVHLHQEAAVFRKYGGPNTSITDLHGMRALAMLGDSVTTDHISPAGSIPKDSPAGKYLISLGVHRGFQLVWRPPRQS